MERSSKPYKGGQPVTMVCETPPLAEPVLYPGEVKIKPPFEMGVGNFEFFCPYLTPA